MAWGYWRSMTAFQKILATDVLRAFYSPPGEAGRLCFRHCSVTSSHWSGTFLVNPLSPRPSGLGGRGAPSTPPRISGPPGALPAEALLSAVPSH